MANMFRFAFNSGEIMPELWNRGDLSRYLSSCQDLQDFLPTPQGAAVSRPGTQFMKWVGHMPELVEGPVQYAKCVAFPAGDVNYVVVLRRILGDDWLYSQASPYGDSVALSVYNATTSDRVAHMITTYAVGDLYSLSTLHCNDVLFLFHRDHPPKRLERKGETSWTLVDAEFLGGPFEDENESFSDMMDVIGYVDAGNDITLADWVSAATYTTGTMVKYDNDYYKSLTNHNGVVLTPSNDPTNWFPWYLDAGTDVIIEATSGDLFDNITVGQKIRIYSGTDLKRSVRWDSNAVDLAVSPVLPTVSEVNVRTTGTWTGKFRLEFTNENADWESVGEFSSLNGDSNYDSLAVVPRFGASTRAKLISRSAATDDSGLNVYLTAKGDHYVYATIKELGHSAADRIVATLDAPIVRMSETYRWSFGAFGGQSGYPSTGVIHDNRLVVAGTYRSGLTLWGSRIDDWVDFRLGIEEDAGYSVLLDSESRSDIHWMVPLRSLVIGTNLAEHTYDPTTKVSRRQTRFGSERVQPVMAGSDIYFVERGGNRIIALRYVADSDNGMEGSDATILSQHLLRDNRIVQMSWANIPQPTLMALRDDGEMLTYTFNTSENVQAWTRNTPGDCLSVTSMPSVGGSGDQVYLLTTRTALHDQIQLVRLEQNNLDLDEQEIAIHAMNGNRSRIYFPSAPTAKCYDRYMGEVIGAVGTGTFIIVDTPPTFGLLDENGGEVVALDMTYMGETGRVFWCASQYPVVYDGPTALTVDEYFTKDPLGCTVVTSDDNNLIYDWGLYPYGTQINEQDILRTDYGVAVIFWSDVPVTARAADSTYHSRPIVACCVPGVINGVQSTDPSFVSNTPEGEILMGVPTDCYLKTLDFVGSPDIGGPGGTTNIIEVEMYVVDSADFEVSTDDGVHWDRCLAMPANVNIGQVFEPFTGKRRIMVKQGWQQNQGAVICVRKASPRKLTVAAIGLQGQRTR